MSDLPDPSSAATEPFELQAMAQANNYYAWLVEHFRLRLHGVVVEHGAGTGLLSARLHAAGVTPLILTEPDEALVRGLRSRFAGVPGIEIFAGTLETFIEQRGTGIADAVISANVLEHVEDDAGCLQAVGRVLKPGGHFCLYVPARPELFGTLDSAFQHHRRYRRGELRRKLLAAGFTIMELKYRNLANALPWWLMGRVFRRSTIDPGQVRLYDRIFFPGLRRFEDLLPMPYGANLLALARAPLDT